MPQSALMWVAYIRPLHVVAIGIEKSVLAFNSRVEDALLAIMELVIIRSIRTKKRETHHKNPAGYNSADNSTIT